LFNAQKNKSPNDDYDNDKTAWLEFVIDVLQMPEKILDPTAEGAGPVRTIWRDHREDDC
jgi:hypothetical protein